MTPSTKIDFRPLPDLVDVIEVSEKAINSKAEQIHHEKMLAERKHISDFEKVLKDIDFRTKAMDEELFYELKVSIKVFLTFYESFQISHLKG